MDFVEHVAKTIFAEHGIPVPQGQLITSAADAEALEVSGPVAVKAQVPAGGRGKAGGVVLVAGDQAAATTQSMIGSDLGDHRVDVVLVEDQVDIDQEYYASIVIDGATCGPLLVFSSRGGVDIEDQGDAVHHLPLRLNQRPSPSQLGDFLVDAGCPEPVSPVGDVIRRMFDVFVATDAEMVEINPLVLTSNGDVIAVDAKLSIDDSAATRRPELAALAAPAPLTGLEAQAAAKGLRYIELDGSVGVLANGAGLTMTTMDVIEHYGGSPANFLEIGGDSYTLAVPALELVLANPKVKSLIVNFCGAFARCDVMAGGVVEAWEQLTPDLPVFFSIHGTGMDEARDLVRNRLGVEPFETMDDAIQAAVTAANGAGQ